jgi:hypothetical protein
MTGTSEAIRVASGQRNPNGTKYIYAGQNHGKSIPDPTGLRRRDSGRERL